MPTTQSKLTVQAPTVGSGIPARLAILGSVGGSAHPCALSRIWGQSLERKFAFLLT
ncbi:hypothetical protein [Desulfosporosinus sp. BICA1-9]|uniref:hypothetical protein n=1 Tax=Desulfosporosinus sp. BICA1-9 TaxID=1531958 RepID=UPI0025C655AE|nr:hypothetical protein [Desulfosporosinus sp. BICA1-9]